MGQRKEGKHLYINKFLYSISSVHVCVFQGDLASCQAMCVIRLVRIHSPGHCEVRDVGHCTLGCLRDIPCRFNLACQVMSMIRFTRSQPLLQPGLNMWVTVLKSDMICHDPTQQYTCKSFSCQNWIIACHCTCLYTQVMVRSGLQVTVLPGTSHGIHPGHSQVRAPCF